jgi:hypothetical protein
MEEPAAAAEAMCFAPEVLPMTMLTMMMQFEMCMGRWLHVGRSRDDAASEAI